MANPSTTARGTPSGIRLKDGYSSKIAFAANSTVSLWEITSKPPGYDGGGGIEHTTMHNDDWRTKDSRSLITVTDATFKCAYDPNAYNQIYLLINTNTSITFHYRDGSTLDIWGFLDKFEPAELVEGQRPEATVTIVATNWDPTNRVEAGPVLTSVAGT